MCRVRIGNSSYVSLVQFQRTVYCLVFQNHQRGVEHERQEDVTREHNRQWHDGRDDVDLVSVRCEFSEVDHAADHGDGEAVHPLEALENLGHFLEEVTGDGLLGGGSPLHVDAEHVGAESEEEMETDAAEEDGEHGHPHEVLEECAEERLLAETVTEDSETDVSKTGEDDEQGDENLPRLNVEGVNVSVLPSDEEVVQDRERKTEGESVVGSNVCKNRDLGGHLHVGPE